MTMNPENSSSGNTVSEAANMDEASVFPLPPSLSVHYEVSSCLKYSEQSSTCLLRQKDTGRVVLLKSASDPLYAKSLINERNILEFIHQQGHPAVSTFPTVLELQEIEHVHYYIRSYIPGKTLEEVCESGLKKPGIPKNQSLNYLIQLTELLDFLHTLTPPIIHRDIKPQNVVVDSEGICHFIDLGISRFFDGTKRSDTLIMGTRITAPPEQFGYQQTDTRSDLYSLGILLHYCITGEYEISDQSLSDLDPDITRIVQKATMFDPDKRYQSANELLSDLLFVRFEVHSGSGNKRSLRSLWYSRIFGGLLAVNLILTGGLLYHNFHREVVNVSHENESDAASGNNGTVVSAAYTFQEPLIEQAVRQILHKEDTPVTEADLELISELHIMGLQIYTEESEFWLKGDYTFTKNEDYQTTGFYLQRGPISSLEDISNMPNLVSLSLYRQQISDISLLKDTSIRELGLGYNPLTNLSPIRDNPSIRSLNVPSLDITDTADISTLPELHSLNISDTGITSLAGLENCPLESLNLFSVKLDNYEDLRGLSSLSWLELSEATPEILTSLSTVPLKTLRFMDCRNLHLDDLSILPKLESVYYRSEELTDLQMTAPNLPNLKELDLVNVRIKDFDRLSSLPELVSLYLYAAECESYEGLDKLPKLLYIGCTAEQQDAIMKLYPKGKFIFQY